MLLVALILMPCSRDRFAFGQSNTHGAVLAIGVNEFGKQKYRFPENDARAIGAAFASHGFRPRVRVGAAAQFPTLLKDVGELSLALRPDQVLVVHFSGGCGYDKSGNLLLAMPLEGAAAPNTGDMDGQAVPSVASFAPALAHARGKVVFVVDGPEKVSAELTPPAPTTTLWLAPGYELPNASHGVFTQSILDSLQQVEASASIDWGSLVQAANERLADSTLDLSRTFGDLPATSVAPPEFKPPFQRLVLIKAGSGMYSDELRHALGPTAAVEFCDLEPGKLKSGEHYALLKQKMAPGFSLIAISHESRAVFTVERGIVLQHLKPLSDFDAVLQSFLDEGTPTLLVGNSFEFFDSSISNVARPRAIFVINDSITRTHLLQVLAQPGLSVRQLAEEVQRRVLDDPNHKRGDVPIFVSPTIALFTVKPN
jgi:hypothetical protein